MGVDGVTLRVEARPRGQTRNGGEFRAMISAMSRQHLDTEFLRWRDSLRRVGAGVRGATMRASVRRATMRPGVRKGEGWSQC